MDPKKASEALARMRALEEELNDKFVERRRPIRGLILSTLAGECAVFLGPPGTAKTMLVEKFYEQFFGQDNVFYRQFSPTPRPRRSSGRSTIPSTSAPVAGTARCAARSPIAKPPCSTRRSRPPAPPATPCSMPSNGGECR